jgi:signal transduction histidine kinase
MYTLFEKFVSKFENGTGLGLFYFKEYCRGSYGGKIWGENNNKDRKEATFTFTLPLAIWL